MTKDKLTPTEKAARPHIVQALFKMNPKSGYEVAAIELADYRTYIEMLEQRVEEVEGELSTAFLNAIDEIKKRDAEIATLKAELEAIEDYRQNPGTLYAKQRQEIARLKEGNRWFKASNILLIERAEKAEARIANPAGQTQYCLACEEWARKYEELDKRFNQAIEGLPR